MRAKHWIVVALLALSAIWVSSANRPRITLLGETENSATYTIMLPPGYTAIAEGYAVTFDNGVSFQGGAFVTMPGGFRHSFTITDGSFGIVRNK